MSFKIADLYCKAGGAGMGLHRSGFEVIGFDIDHQRRYPFEFRQRDVMEIMPEELREFDAVWASPPCQRYSVTKNLYNPSGQGLPDLMEPTRELLIASGLPFIIENVAPAPFNHWIELCGLMFGLRTYRHRRFETSWMLWQPEHPTHVERCLHGEYNPTWKGFITVAGGGNVPLATMSEVMGIDWMTTKELTQAIPPVYAEYLGKELLEWLHNRMTKLSPNESLNGS